MTKVNPFIEPLPKWVKPVMSIPFFDPKTRKTSNVEVKVDMDVEIQRALTGVVFTILNNKEITKAVSEGDRVTDTDTLILHRVDGKVPISCSIPKHLFGNDYFRARRTNDDIFDLRKASFKPVEK